MGCGSSSETVGFNFDSSISHLQDALQHISSWMTANLLTLNSSKTEFLLIGLENQLTKIHNSSLDTSHATRNLGFIFDEHLTFSNQITAFSKAYYYLSLNYPIFSRSSTLLLILSLKLPSPVILLPSYALSTGSRSLNASKTKSSSHLPTKFSQLPNLPL